MDAASTGLAFTNVIPERRHLTNQILLNGSGLAAGDVDGDGRTDVFLAGFDNDCALYRNLGDWRFVEVAAEAGVRLPGLDCTGAAFGDLDGDGDLDLVVNTLGQGTWLLFNDGRGRFTRFPAALNPGRGGMTAALADVDGDGFLDVYVANYRTRALMDMPSTRMTFRKVGGRMVVDTVNGRPASDPEFQDRFVVNESGGIEENGEPDVMYRNLGGTNFVEVPWTGGLFLDEDGAPLAQPPRDWGLAAMFRDVDHDGRPDLYVCNDFQSPDRFWLNLGGGRFRAAPRLALRRISLSSMAVDFADLNRDGHEDFLVLEMLSREQELRMRWVKDAFPHRPVIGRYDDRPQYDQNTLHLGRGDGTWAEIAQLSGVEATEWSWGGAFLDVDLDGWEDLLVVNGMERAARDLDAAEQLKAARGSRRLSEAEIFEARKAFPRLATANLAFRNLGDLTFREVGREWGFDLPAVSPALALADLDNDGDLDVIVGNLNQAVAVYRNDATAPRVAVRLAGRPPNTCGIGARLEVLGGPVPQSQQMIGGGRYLSGDDPVRSFAAGGASSLTIRVNWPDGAVSEVTDVPPNSLVEIAEAAARRPSPPGSAAVKPSPGAPGSFRFEDLTADLNHRHAEEPMDDFARQPLLPWRLSQPGPGLAWVDLDQDGDDDLIVGTGRGGRLGVFRNEGGGRWVAWGTGAPSAAVPRDVTGLIAWPRSNGKSVVLAGLANYEDGAPLGASVVAWDPAKPTWDEWIPAFDSSVGPLAMADVDGDGDLDLFVGGRVVPGRWPAAASSRFYLQEGGRWTLSTERSRPLTNLGLVSGAAFGDLDGDGDADLVLAGEWGPIRVFRQEPGGFVEVSREWGVESWRGWWNSVALGDFDNDGRLDLVAGNAGRNTPYEFYLKADRPDGADALRVYHGDWNEDAVYDVLEAGWDGTRQAWVPIQQFVVLSQALPQLRARFPSHAAFGRASLSEILGETERSAGVCGANWLATTVFLNRGDRFEGRALPVEAQMAPVFGIAVADADGDGNQDLFLAQNFFAVRTGLPRCDAGLGLWLAGDGRGGFRAVPASDSGVRITGEQRGAAVADFDGDGRADLAVGQNGAATRLFRNQGGRPGLRVQLSGPPSNPAGVGARLRWAEGGGPAHAVQLGGGYLSQDSTTTVLARAPGQDRLRVWWPGSTNQVRDYPVPATARQVVLKSDGTLRSEAER